MANFGWIYLIHAGLLAKQEVKVRTEQQVYHGQAFPVKHVTPAALDGSRQVRDLLGWIDEETQHGLSQHGEGAYLVTEFFLSFGIPGITQAAQFEPEWMFIDDLNALTSDNPTVRERLRLGHPDLSKTIETTKTTWDALTRTLPRAIQLLRRLPGWHFLSRDDMASLMKAFTCLPADELHLPGDWEEVFYQLRTGNYDYAAVLFESEL